MSLLAPIAVALGLTSAALGGVSRHALIVGHDLGRPGDTPLLFAQDDAERLARVLTSTGGTDPTRTTTLLAPSRNQLLHAMADLREAVAEDAARGDDTVVLFYFSGHADDQAMHLGRTDVRWTELQTLLDQSGADVRVALLDACQSGAMAQERTKGAARAPAFAVELTEQLTASGQVVLTSSAANEVSHESDALGGSYFTHHLISALAGAADADADGRVTLVEAWRHVARETAFDTRDSRGGAQTPTYAWELSGTGDLMLTAPREGEAHLVLPAGLTGRIAVFDVDRRAFVAEVHTHASRPTEVALAAGEYLVQQRLPTHLEVARITLEEGETVALHAAGFSALQYEDDAIKGALEVRSRRARRPELRVSAGPQVRVYSDPADAVLSIPATTGLSVSTTAQWVRGPWVGFEASTGTGEGAVNPTVPWSRGTAQGSVWSVGGGWSTPPAVFGAAAGLQLSHLVYTIDYPDVDLGGPQELRTTAPGLIARLGVYPRSMSIELSVRAHEVRYTVDGAPAGIRFVDTALTFGARL